MTLSACQDLAPSDPTADDDLASDPLTTGGELARRPPELRIVFAGGGLGEISVTDFDGFVLATCTRSCTVPATEGQGLVLVAASPSVYGGLSGACTTRDSACDVTIGASRTVVTATFTPAPGEVWTRLTGGGPLFTAAYDAAGRLIVGSSGDITKLSPGGGVIWQRPIGVCSVATGPRNTIYAQTFTDIVKLAADGTTLWSHPLDPHAVGCGRGGGNADGFVHNLAVGSDGAVAIHGDTGVARWDTNGNLTWAVDVESRGLHGIAIDPRGVVHASIESELGETVDLVRFAADGTPLEPLEHVAGQPSGMFVIDPVGRLLTTGSGHSHTSGFGHSVDLPFDPDFAPNGIAAASSDVVWLHEAEDVNTFFAREWTVDRFHADGSLASSHTRFVFQRDFFDFFGLGTNPHDIAGSLDGHFAIVGEFSGPTSGGGWIVTFAP